MNLRNLLVEVSSEAGALVFVEPVYSAFENPDAVHLNFERASYTVGQNPDDDTITLLRRKLPSIHPASEVEPFSRAIGKRVLWAWILTNQQGYTDGLQFEFWKSAEEEQVVVQFIAEASQLFVRQVPACHFGGRRKGK